MNRTLIGLAVVAATAMPVAAFAHTDVSIGLGLGGPVYVPPPAVYIAPEPVYAPPPVVYAQPGYVYTPPVVYGPPVVYDDRYYGPRYRHPYGYRY